METTPKRGRGRPKTWTPDRIVEAKAEICRGLSHGDSLVTICKRRGMPSDGTVFEWLTTDEVFAGNYARARQGQAASIYEEIKRIEVRMQLAKTIVNPAYDAKKAHEARVSKGTIEYYEPATIPNPDFVDDRVGRVLIDSMKWRLARMDPKQFGDRAVVDVSGQVNHSHKAVDNAPDWVLDLIGKKQETPAVSPPAGGTEAKPAADSGATVH